MLSSDNSLSRGVAGRVLAYIGAFFILVIIFQEALLKSNISAFGLFDELLVGSVLALCMCRVLFRQRATRQEMFLVVIFLYLVLISIFMGHQPDYVSVLIQSVIHIKFFAIFVFVEYVYGRSLIGLRRLQKIAIVALVISMIGFFLNLVQPQAFLNYFSAIADTRGGMQRVLGFQLKPNDFAFLLSVSYALIVFGRIKKWGPARLGLLTVLFAGMIVLNGSRTALLILPMVWFFVFLNVKKYRFWILLGGVVLGSVALFVISDTLDYMINETIKNLSQFSVIEQSEYIRGIMIYYGDVLFLKYFPIGTGAATFGSVLSANSTVYQELGLASLTFFENMEGVFDSNLATIMGEFGLIGLLLYGYGLFNSYKVVMRYSSYGDGLGVSCCKCLVVFAFFIFITNPFFMYQYNSMLFSVGMVLTRLIDQE